MNGGGKIKVHYFPVYGRAEHIKMMLTYAKKDWESVVVTGEQWKEMKPKLECPGLP